MILFLLGVRKSAEYRDSSVIAAGYFPIVCIDMSTDPQLWNSISYLTTNSLYGKYFVISNLKFSVSKINGRILMAEF